MIDRFIDSSDSRGLSILRFFSFTVSGQVRGFSYHKHTQLLDASTSTIDLTYFSINGEWALVATDVTHFVLGEFDTVSK